MITGIRTLAVELSDGASNSFRFFGDADVTVRAKAGVDDIRSNAGFDLLESGEGDDRLVAEGGNDILDGGLGNDDLSAGPGDDEVLARDGVRDSLNCGSGIDHLDMDLRDGTPPASCEKVDQGATNEGPNVRVLSTRVVASRSGVVAVLLACPRRVRRGCAGTLSLAIRGAGKIRRRYRVKRARRSRVRLRLGATARRALARRGRLRARLVSIERGVHGRKTTIRPLDVRRKRRSRRAAHAPRARSAALSSTVSFVAGSGLRIQGAAGVKNRVRIKFLSDPARFRVVDDSEAIAAGSGCQILTADSVTCDLRGPRTIRAFLGDRDDTLEFELDSAGGADAVIDGGPSFDRLQGANGYDVLIGGTADDGTDDLRGLGGNDALLGGPGADTLTGGAGNDFATGDAGSDRLFLRDGMIDRYCETEPALLDVDSGAPTDVAACPADQF